MCAAAAAVASAAATAEDVGRVVNYAGKRKDSQQNKRCTCGGKPVKTIWPPASLWLKKIK